jgi:light-regulated signal transduction histidine kinase (bacteriophytochrome)
MTRLPVSNDSKLDRESLLRRITNRIRQSLDLQEILNATVTEMRSVLGTDRVMVYKFHPDESGQVIAESLQGDRLLSLVGLNFPADDIPPQAREQFLSSRGASVVDVAAGQIGQSYPYSFQTNTIAPSEPISSSIHYRSLDPCHAKYLTAMGVKSSFVVPIIHQERLWGLLVSHHAEPKVISEELLYATQLVVEQLSIAIAQSDLLRQACERADRQTAINRITALLHSLPSIELQRALEETIAAFEGSGGRLFIAPNAFPSHINPTVCPVEMHYEIYVCGVQPTLPKSITPRQLEQHRAWLAPFQTNAPLKPWAIADLYEVSEFKSLQAAFQETAIRSLLIVPLQVRQQLIGCLSIFRNEVETKTLWAGQFDSDERQLYPRSSFAAWCESKSGQARQWSANDMSLAKALGRQFALAIEQHHLYQQVRRFNVELEHQVAERTAQLSQTLENLQKAQTQLIQNEKMSSLGQLVAGVAHEINNPVNFIYGNLAHVTNYAEDLLDLVQLYQRHYSNPVSEVQSKLEEIDLEFLGEDLPKTLASMRIGADRIRQIVLSLRTFSRLDQAEVKLVDIHEGLDSTVLILQHRLKNRLESPPIHLIKEYSELPLIECYAGQLNQVFMNLIGNAIDALEDWNTTRSSQDIEENPATIRVQTKVLNASWIAIHIIDNGPGMTAETRQHLFDPFFTTKPVGKGTGLGLSISYQIITEKHGGRLQCASAPGQGAEFIVEIPIQQF